MKEYFCKNCTKFYISDRSGHLPPILMYPGSSAIKGDVRLVGGRPRKRNISEDNYYRDNIVGIISCRVCIVRETCIQDKDVVSLKVLTAFDFNVTQLSVKGKILKIHRTVGCNG